MYNKEEKKLLNLYLKGEKKKNLTLCLFIYLQKKHKMIRQQKRIDESKRERVEEMLLLLFIHKRFLHLYELLLLTES